MNTFVRTTSDTSVDDIVSATRRYAHMHTVHSHLFALCATVAIALGLLTTTAFGLAIGLVAALTVAFTLAASIDAVVWERGRELGAALKTLTVSGASPAVNQLACIDAALWLSASHDRLRHRHLPSEANRESASWLLNRGLGSCVAYDVLSHPRASLQSAPRHVSRLARSASASTIAADVLH